MGDSGNSTTSNYSISTVTPSTTTTTSTTMFSSSPTTLTNNLISSTLSELTTVHFLNETVDTTTTATSTTAATITQSHIENITQPMVNLTKIATEILTTQGTTGTSTSSLCSTSGPRTTTEDPMDEFAPPEGVEYIFVPLGVMIFVIILSAVVIIISRKRKMERLRHRLMPLYNFDPGEEGEDDWETELLDEGFTSRQRRQGYQSMDMEENAELFSNTDASSRIMF